MNYTASSASGAGRCRCEVEARPKLLITLSDGKPDNYDTYRGAVLEYP